MNKQMVNPLGGADPGHRLSRAHLLCSEHRWAMEGVHGHIFPCAPWRAELAMGASAQILPQGPTTNNLVPTTNPLTASDNFTLPTPFINATPPPRQQFSHTPAFPCRDCLLPSHASPSLRHGCLLCTSYWFYLIVAKVRGPFGIR